MDWLKENITWIRDILIPLFSLVLLIIAVLTYKRAKDTLLQPIRSEVIKHQANLLTELLDYIARTQSSAEDIIDYQGICYINFFLWLDEYGFVLANHKDIEKDVLRIYGGFIARARDDNTIRDVELITPFTPKLHKPKDKPINESKKRRYEKAKSGDSSDVKIDKIFLTKRNNDFWDTCDKFFCSPFMPSSTSRIYSRIHSNPYLSLKGKF